LKKKGMEEDQQSCKGVTTTASPATKKREEANEQARVSTNPNGGEEIGKPGKVKDDERRLISQC